MLYSIPKADLFTDLSQEQQELVTGGQALLAENFAQNNFNLSETNYLAELSEIKTLSTSGPGGSMTTGDSIFQKIETTGKNTMSLL